MYRSTNTEAALKPAAHMQNKVLPYFSYAFQPHFCLKPMQWIL